MEEFNSDEPEEIIITGDGKESDSTGGKSKKEGADGDSDSDGDGAKVDKDAPEEGEKKENEGGEENEGGKGEDGEPKPKDEEDEDGEEDDDETIEEVDCAIVDGSEKGFIGKIDKNDIRAEKEKITIFYDYNLERFVAERPLRKIILLNDYVAYKKSSDATAIYVGKVIGFSNVNDIERNQLYLSVYNPISYEYDSMYVNVSSILHKMPNCAIVSGKYKGRVGCFYEEDKDETLGLQYVELFENSGGEWKGNAKESVIALFDYNEFVTFGNKVIVSRESRDYKGVIEPRYISWGIPSNCDGIGDNYVWFAHNDFNSRLWEAVTDISEIDFSNEGQGIFESLTIQIVEDIISQFKEKGTFPSERENFIYCHFPKAIRKSIVLLDRANGMDNQRLDIEIKTTLETIIEFDREVAKTLLRHIQSSGYNFDPIYGFGSIFYDCLKELGVFNMVNTALVQDNMNVVSIYRDKNRLFFYSTIGYIFMEEIIFGDRKNITKFALWQNERAERIDALYSLLNFLVGTSRDKENYKDVVKYPEINEEVGRIFLLQLKAFEDAI
jgi:hypothetical protein